MTIEALFLRVLVPMAFGALAYLFVEVLVREWQDVRRRK